MLTKSALIILALSISGAVLIAVVVALVIVFTTADVTPAATLPTSSSGAVYPLYKVQQFGNNGGSAVALSSRWLTHAPVTGGDSATSGIVGGEEAMYASPSNWAAHPMHFSFIPVSGTHYEIKSSDGMYMAIVPHGETNSDCTPFSTTCNDVVFVSSAKHALSPTHWTLSLTEVNGKSVYDVREATTGRRINVGASAAVSDCITYFGSFCKDVYVDDLTSSDIEYFYLIRV